MSGDEYAQRLLEGKRRTRYLDPSREFILAELEEYPEITSAIIDGKLRMEYADFKPSYRAVRHYIVGLREELGMPQMKVIRQFTEIAELPPGLQAQVDMREQWM